MTVNLDADRVRPRKSTARGGRGVLREGAIVGVLGATVVALWFLALDAMAGVPFRTPALLGAALFDGARDPATVAITPRLVLGYTVIHGALFLGLGLAAAGLFAVAERQPKVLFAIFMLFCCLVVVVLAAITLLAQWLFDMLAPWTVLSGTLLAGAAMAAVLFSFHRRALLRHARWAGE
jgi:hypothetical protein